MFPQRSLDRKARLQPIISALAILLALLPLATATSFSASASTSSLSLSDFQKINGFPTACTAAYNGPIASCTTADFALNAPCSSQCISGLQSIASTVNAACAGVSADPSTLIGHVFDGTAVPVLCPNSGIKGASTASSSAGDQSRSDSADGGAAGSTSLPSSVSTTSTSVASASTTEASASSTLQPQASPLASSSSSTTTSSVSAATSSSAPLSSQPPISQIITASDGGSGGLTSSTSSSIPPSSTAGTNGQSFGGDVNPFTSSASSSSARGTTWLSLSLGVLAVLNPFFA